MNDKRIFNAEFIRKYGMLMVLLLMWVLLLIVSPTFRTLKNAENILRHGRVYPKMCRRHLEEELPFLATENILMHAVTLGGDRQELHEKIRELSMKAGTNVKEKGLDNNLLELIANDEAFPMSLEELKESMNPARYVGRAPSQVTEFITKEVRPVLKERQDMLGLTPEIKV